MEQTLGIQTTKIVVQHHRQDGENFLKEGNSTQVVPWRWGTSFLMPLVNKSSKFSIRA
jgi:hypothetical protein